MKNAVAQIENLRYRVRACQQVAQVQNLRYTPIQV